jgi:hypothetical protein
MKRLNQEVKEFIVQHLACYCTPQQVVGLVKVEFKVDVTRQQVRYYDPTKGPKDKSLEDDLQKLFEKTREAFRKKLSEHAIADQGYRLGRLQRMSEQAEQAGNIPLAAELLEQAAKECGGQFTNRQKQDVNLSGQVATTMMTVEEFKRQASERRSQAEKTMAQFESDIPVDHKQNTPAIALTPVESSNIAAIGYDEESKTVAVRFLTGGVYHVSPVEPDRYASFLAAESKGRFYNRNFKNAQDVTVTKVNDSDQSAPEA